MNLTKKIGATVSALVLGLSLAACGADSEPTTGTDGATEDLGTINLGFVASWTDGLSTAYLLDNQLTKMGYTVEMDEIGDAALIYAALSKGDVDMYPSAWPEVTHADYMKTYGDKIDDIGTYYDNAQLTWAVPEYMDDVNSIEDLKGMGAEFGGKVIGIEPGAGLTKASLENVLPDYELKGEYELVTSSTPAMLAELKKATGAEKSIVVTLWQPFWANAAFPVKTLEDPKGALGGAEGLHFLGKTGFADEYPDAAKWISELKLDDAQYGSLEDTVVNQYEEGQEAEAVSAWIEENPDVLPEIKN
ncbi:MAG: glycine betaine ABC transporter substrate-binding protein [Propionibacteriaceae bacterium]|nr:glycine betaine ABC transporter substrate-binding protein [Propionibacteriaceae bacterium]